jgi:hypothetical protein
MSVAEFYIRVSAGRNFQVEEIRRDTTRHDATRRDTTRQCADIYLLLNYSTCFGASIASIIRST